MKKNLITTGLVTGLIISNCLMVFASDNIGDWQNLDGAWYYVGQSGNHDNREGYYYNADGTLKNELDMEKFIRVYPILEQ